MLLPHLPPPLGVWRAPQQREERVPDGESKHASHVLGPHLRPLHPPGSEPVQADEELGHHPDLQGLRVEDETRAAGHLEGSVRVGAGDGDRGESEGTGKVEGVVEGQTEVEKRYQGRW